MSPMKHRPVAFGLLSLSCLVIGWEAAVRVGWFNPFFTSQPSAIAAALAAQASTGELWANLRVSLTELAAGLGLAIVVGVTLGLLAGSFPRLEYALDPFIWFLYAAPLIAFYPLFVIWFGLGTWTVVAITFLLSVTPITINTLSGMKNVDASLMRAARSFGARRSDLFLRVALPASVPLVMAGLRLGVGRALTGVVIAELFGATAGLGFSINYYGALLQTTNMLASLTVVVALGVILTQSLSAIEARFDSWR